MSKVNQINNEEENKISETNRKFERYRNLGVAFAATAAIFSAIGYFSHDSEDEVIRKAKLNECFAKVTDDYKSFQERRVKIYSNQAIEFTVVKVQNENERVRYFPDLNQLSKEQDNRQKHSSKNTQESENFLLAKVTPVVFAGGADSPPPYKQVTPTKVEYENLQGFRACLGLPHVPNKDIALKTGFSI